MAMSDGAIPLGCKRAMTAKSQPAAELELVGSSSSAMTPPPPTATRTWDDGDSDGDDEGTSEFAGFTDQRLQESIKKLRCLALLKLPDGGVKLRRHIRRMEKEVDRRRTAGSRKDVMTWRRAVQPPSQDNYHDSKDGSKFSQGIVSSKYHLNLATTPANNYEQVEESAFFKELSYFGQGKHACLKKVGQSASTPVSHTKRTDDKKMNMDNEIIYNKRKLGLKSCLRKRQRNISFDSNCAYDKPHTKEDTFGRSTKRWEPSKNHTAQSNSKERKKQKDVVLLDDEDMEPAESDEITHKLDESKIYYPSRTDMETVELTYSDIKCLEPEEYLKSPVINFYMQYLRKSRTCGDLYMFSTYFYSKLEEALSRMGDHDDSQFRKLRRWWKNVDIFRQAYIILPIHGKMHWSLIIICMPAKETGAGPMILHLDSLGLHSSRKVFDVIDSYLKAEWQHLQNDSSYIIPFSGRIWSHLSKNISKEKIEVPSQPNQYDCGIFMLHYIERFIQEAPERLTRENLRMFGRKWFDPEETAVLRDRIQSLLFDSFESTQMDGELSQSDDQPGGEENQPGDEDKDGDTAVMIVVID
ncbi:ubiquitin-like-specific protease 1D [Oryza brachyantha]|uniref:ubiquitin-like-specific protease 1D n=1 Tax=Oryza brachyantha TaxID=4533 RepID=UPI0007765BD9|nr:ubiquitin-like-specific protease 1D [Oryza brachyantha]